MTQEKSINFIADLWADFQRKTLPVVSETQRREMKRAFFAGAQALFILCTIDDGVSEAMAVKVLSSVHRELLAFGVSVAGGRE